MFANDLCAKLEAERSWWGNVGWDSLDGAGIPRRAVAVGLRSSQEAQARRQAGLGDAVWALSYPLFEQVASESPWTRKLAEDG
jgi:hypothetical protein